MVAYCLRRDERKLRDLLARLCDECRLPAFAWKGSGTSAVLAIGREREQAIREYRGEQPGDLYVALVGERRDARFVVEDAYGLQTPSTHTVVAALLRSLKG